jgi:HlyD family secretion protein
VAEFMRLSAQPRSTTTVGALFVIASFKLMSPLWAADAETTFAPAVTVIQSKRSCFADALEVTGVVVPAHEILVRPPREGLEIAQVLVQHGDAVIAGQVLARLKAPTGLGTSSDTAVKAPAGGIVFSMSAVAGAAATASGDPLFRIAQGGEMDLAVETPVNAMPRLAIDQMAKVQIIGISDELTSKVRFISKAINQTTQVGEVRLLLDADQRLRVGAFGRGKIEIGQRCGLAIPLSAVLYARESPVVQVVRDEKVETRRVTVGLMKGGDVEIRDGLSEGEAVVARAGAFVRDGDRVRPVITKSLDLK